MSQNAGKPPIRIVLKKTQVLRMPSGPSAGGAQMKPTGRGQTFTKIFRWRLPEGQPKPGKVEIAGTFTHWQKMPLVPDRIPGTWQITLHQILFNRTHHYMLFVDGKPVQDKHCDGLAVPHGPVEEQHALQTPRGPRVFMLFAQTK